MLPSDGHPPRCSLTNLTPPQHHKPHGILCWMLQGDWYHFFHHNPPKKKNTLAHSGTSWILPTRTMVTCDQCPGIRNHISRNMFRNDTNDTFAVACNLHHRQTPSHREPSRHKMPSRYSETQRIIIYNLSLCLAFNTTPAAPNQPSFCKLGVMTARVQCKLIVQA